MTNILAKTILKEMQEEIKAAGNLTKDVEALDIAIKALERTALEVPVQEQNKITSSLSYGAGNFKSITLYNDKERFERVYEIHEDLNSIGLLLTPEVLKFNNINSIDEIFMIGILQDK